MTAGCAPHATALLSVAVSGSDGCCAPRRESASATTGPQAAGLGDGAASAGDFVTLSGGTFAMGTDGRYGYPADGEGPSHEVDAVAVRDRSHDGHE